MSACFWLSIKALELIIARRMTLSAEALLLRKASGFALLRIFSTNPTPPQRRISSCDQTTSPLWTIPAGSYFPPDPVKPPSENPAIVCPAIKPTLAIPMPSTRLAAVDLLITSKYHGLAKIWLYACNALIVAELIANAC